MSSGGDDEEKIQIVAFSTNDTHQTPNDLINMFLEQHNHLILKKSRHAIAFSTSLNESNNKSTKIMICSVLNLTREYTGITDVNCYILYIDLEKEDSKEKYESIINYAKDYCDLTKKVFVFGMRSGNSEGESNTNENEFINKNEITKVLENAQLSYSYKEINLSKPEEVSASIMEVLTYSTKHSINGDKDGDKDAGQAGSCSIF